MSTPFPGESPEYRKARERLLVLEIEMRRAMEAVAMARRKLPSGGRVAQDYVFDGLDDHGVPAKIRLSQLFAPGKDCLLIYDFMFPRHKKDLRPGPTSGATARLKLEDGPCPSCTAFIDSLDRAASQVQTARCNVAVVAAAPLAQLTAFAQERGWRLRMLSAAGNTFKRDYHSETADGSTLALMTVFQREADGIRFFWSSEMAFAPADPGQDTRTNCSLDLLWNLFDLTLEGRPAGWRERIDV